MKSFSQLPAGSCDGTPDSFTGGTAFSTSKHDDVNSSSDNQFTQGSKDGNQINQNHWVAGEVNDKGDIGNATVALIKNSAGNYCILRFSADRFAVNGDAAIGFWFYQDPSVSVNPDGTFSGTHMNGDILIVSQFTNGGGTSTPIIYQWENGQLVLVSGTATYACSATNSSLTDAPSNYVSKSGPAGKYQPGAFFEGAVDLCGLGLSTCFSSFLLETRNSQSIDASLQDFVFGSFQTKPSVTLADVTVCAGQNATFTAIASGGVGTLQYSFKTSSVNGGAYGAYSTSNTFTINNVTTSQNNQTVSVKVKGANGCESDAATATLHVNPNPTANPASDAKCSSTSTATFNLTALTSTIIGSQTGVSVSFYTDAAGTNAISNPASYSSGSGTVYAVVSNTSTQCKSQPAPITLTVNPNPTANPASDAKCSSTSTATFNLTALTSTIIGSQTGVSVSFYTDAAGTNAISNPASYSSGSGTVYARVTNTTTGCKSPLVPITLTVNSNPTANPASATQCSDNATATFNLTTLNSTVAGSQSGATVTWYSDAALTMPIATPTAYVTSGGTVYAKVTVGTCTSGPATVTLTVNRRPDLKITNPAPVCAPATVNLTAAAITAGSSLYGGTLSYYTNSTATTPLTNPAAVSTSGTYYIKAQTAPDCYVIKPVTVTINNCAVTYCTYTQGFYGNSGGKACNGSGQSYSTAQTITNAINGWGGKIIIGSATGNRIELTTANVNDIISRLPGGGSSYVLKSGVSTLADYTSSRTGRINNTLLAQTLTLALNIGINTTLANLQLQGGKYLVTQNVTSCGSKTPVSCAYHAYYIDPAVVNALTTKTVGGLLSLANAALAGSSLPSGVSLSSIANLVDLINNAFDGCRLFVGYYTQSEYNSLTSGCTTSTSVTTAARDINEVNMNIKMASVTAYPNPYNSSVRFTLLSPVSGHASLEVFNELGQKVRSVFEGNLQAGESKTFEYDVPAIHRSTLIYVLRQGSQTVTGKVMQAKQ